MKKISLFATVAFLAATTLTSCDDCITCEFADGVTADAELCDATAAQEDIFVLAQEAAAAAAGTTVSCD